MSEMTRENARKIDFYGSTLEDCVNWLLKFQEKGESVVVEFKGHNLYSCDVTMDSAYIEITGQTKEEFDADKEKWRKEYQEREKAEAEAKIPAWIEKGEAPELSESRHASKNINSELLGAMSKTESWLTLENLQTVLPQEQYQELLTTVRSGLEQRYAKLDLTDVTQEEIEKEIEERISGEIFVIGVDDNGGFILQQFFCLPRDKVTRPIDLSQLDATKLASVVEKAMQKHLDYGVFYSNGYLTAEQIPQTLEQYIDLAREYQSRNIENSNETVEVEAEQGDELSDGRQAEEKEIIALSSEKEQLTSEIGDTEQQLEELRAQEEKLKRESKAKGIEEK